MPDINCNVTVNGLSASRACTLRHVIDAAYILLSHIRLSLNLLCRFSPRVWLCMDVSDVIKSWQSWLDISAFLYLHIPARPHACSPNGMRNVLRAFDVLFRRRALWPCPCLRYGAARTHLCLFQPPSDSINSVFTEQKHNVTRNRWCFSDVYPSVNWL